MNAPNPSSTDRDLESLRRAQRAHEPSMEEILASIRSIIADDRESPTQSAPAQKASPPAGPQIVFTNNAVAPSRPVAPAPEAVPAAPPAPPPAAVAAAPPKVVWEKPVPSAEPAAAEPSVPAALESSPAPNEEEPFASPETEAAVAASFHALSATVAMQSSEMIESLTREMLRPMLKSWLDDNLPSIVERLVRAEIQRVARGGR
jgi:cell pole-organizing protein PopZ